MEGNFVIVFITVGIMAPIIEEIIFRGLVLNELKKVVPACPAIILQAIIFGIYHMNPLQGVYASLLGIVLGIAAEKTGSIWTPILIHISFNSISTLLSKMPVDIPESYFPSSEHFAFVFKYCVHGTVFCFDTEALFTTSRHHLRIVEIIFLKTRLPFIVNHHLLQNITYYIL